MTENIAAYTEAGSDYPAYISINRVEGQLVISARERGHNGAKCVSLEISERDLVRLGRSIAVNAPTCHCRAGDSCPECDPGG